MKIHRFYAPETALVRDFWVNDKSILHQWLKVLRFKSGQKLSLFNGNLTERIYEIVEVSKKGVRIRHISDVAENKPTQETYLFWSLLKKDNNELILQKATELGVGHFVPIISERTEVRSTGANKMDRWNKIIIEAVEQSGRSDIPKLYQPKNIGAALDSYAGIRIFVAQQGKVTAKKLSISNPMGVLIGPEGGWSNEEQEMFKQNNLDQLSLGQFTLRAETAAIVAISKTMQ